MSFMVFIFWLISSSENTWEPIENLTNCKARIRKFEASYNKNDTDLDDYIGPIEKLSFKMLDSKFKGFVLEKIVGGTLYKEMRWLLVQWKDVQQYDLLPYEYINLRYPNRIQELTEFQYFK